MRDREYVKMDAVEEQMFFYRALHERVWLCLDRFVSRGASVLDAGCGTGGLLHYLQLRRPDLRLFGVDVSPIACEIAREKTGLRIEEGSVEALPFGDGEFDAIVSADVLSMLENQEPALRESRRCLRDGGILVVNVAAYPWLHSYHDVETDTKHRFGREELVTLLEQNGFAASFATYWNTLLFPLVVIKRKLLPPSGESDVKLRHALMERAFSAVLSFEAAATRRFLPLPFGLSVLAVARRL